MKKFVSLLKKKGACSEGLDFALAHADAKTAWEACTNPDYMLWALAEFDLVDDKKHRLFACWCARHTPIGNGKTNWDLLTDERSRNAVIVAQRFANGDATQEELSAAWAAARAAARSAARSAWAASARSAWAAESAESAAESAWARSAWAAESAESAAASAWAAAESAAESAASAAQAKALRDIYGFPFESVLASRRKQKGAPA
jgi:hypothetical protein